jgi:xylulokinase
LVAAGVDINPDGHTVLVGGGARSPAYQRVLADLSGREVTVARPDASPVATGACVQAAAVLTGASPSEVASAWTIDRGDVVGPDRTVDAAAIRAAYAAARD